MKLVVDEGRWLATEPSTSEQELRERFRAGIEDGHVLVLAEDGHVVVGSTDVHPTGVEGVWSLGTWLLPGYRRRGLGRLMLDVAVEAAVAEGARKIELEVFTNNEGAIALYRSAGFTVEGTRRDHYPREDGSLKSAVVMALFPGSPRSG